MSERKDRIKEETTTTGTGTVSLSGTAPVGFLTFVTSVTSLATVRYFIESTDLTEWEVGEGVFTDGTPDTLSRVTVFASSNAGSLVNFSAGTKTASLSLVAEDLKQATGAEINTGTSDIKIVTPKAIADSTIIKSTDTLSNRINPRTTTEASSATPTINSNNTDTHTITALATEITSMTTNLSGTPVNGQKLIIRILDNGTARAIAWGARFASRGATLPVTTVISKYLYIGLIYNSTASVWDCVAVVNE